MNRNLTRRELLKLIGVSGIATLTANSISNLALALPPRSGKIDPSKYGIMILVDGLRSDLFFQMVDSNKLPNIKEHLVDRGVSMECVGPLPSTTGPAHLPFLTGTFPGKNDVTGIRWVDRVKKICRDYCSSFEGVMINQDYGLKVPTLFDVLRDHETAAIYEIVNQGAKIIKIPNLKEAWWTKRADWESFDEQSVDIAEDLYKKNPLRFTFIWMPGVDHIAHFEGPRSEVVQNELIAIDKYFARIIGLLEKHHIYDKTLIALVADHGLRDNEKHLDLANYLSSLGLAVKIELSTGGEWSSIYRYNAVVAVSGNAFAHVYLCDDEGKLGKSISVHDWWWEPKKKFKPHFFHGWKWEREVSYESLRNFPLSGNKRIDLIQALLDHKGVNILLTSEKWGRYFVFSSSGQGLIEQDSNKYRYSVVNGIDPLGYNSHPETAVLMSDGLFHSSDEWLRAGWSSKYVDAIIQFSQIFKSERCGDIIVLAKSGWDLMDQGHIGSHGGPEREEVLVPAVLAGNGITRKKIKYVRTADIFPTYLKFFGLNPSQLEIDGRVIDIFA
jgi:hypothetical protein